MTEKEFLDKLSTKDSPSYSYSALLALELAKQHGAKFDPSLVELPKLRICGGPKACLIGSSDKEKGLSLSSEKALEVIRRCELIPRLRSLISPYQVYSVKPLLDMIDGRDVQSGEGEDHAINP